MGVGGYDVFDAVQRDFRGVGDSFDSDRRTAGMGDRVPQDVQSGHRLRFSNIRMDRAAVRLVPFACDHGGRGRRTVPGGRAGAQRLDVLEVAAAGPVMPAADDRAGHRRGLRSVRGGCGRRRR